MCSYTDRCEGCDAKPVCIGIPPHSKHIAELIRVVSNFSEEHPLKTRLMDFKEKFPNYNYGITGIPFERPSAYGYCGDRNNDFSRCYDCLYIAEPSSKCWNQPLEGKKKEKTE
jgi:hypothetical protein